MILSKSIRIKITGTCNRACFFCHKEGNMDDIENIEFNEELKRIIYKLKNDFSINRIALTGGEPLMHPNIEEFVHSIRTETDISNISITTNGSVPSESFVWEKLKNNGLAKVNISISEILNNAKNPTGERYIFANQINLITILNSLNIQVNINIVVFNDFYSLENTIKCLLKLKDDKNLSFDIVLLPNLNNYNNSIKTIKEFCQRYNLVKKKTLSVSGTSNSVETYTSDSLHEIYIKTTKLSGTPFLLNSICTKCEIKDICQEGFYGLRLEKRNNKINIRLCIHKDTEEVVMPFDKFIHSNVYKELLKDLKY